MGVTRHVIPALVRPQAASVAIGTVIPAQAGTQTSAEMDAGKSYAVILFLTVSPPKFILSLSKGGDDGVES